MPAARSLLALAALLAFVAPPRIALAEEPPIPEHRVTYDNLTAVRVNPLGLESRYNLAWRARLYEHESAALRDNNMSIVGNAVLGPAASRFGGTFEVRPATVLTLSAGVHRIGYFGTFQFMQGFADAQADFSDSALRAGTDAGRNYPAGGTDVELRAQALAKVGPIVVRSDTTAYWTDLELREGQTVYYTPRYDLLMPDEGWALTSDNDVLYMSDFGLVAGARVSVGASFYEPAQRGGAEDPNSPTVRAGPVAAYVFFDEPGAAFNKPTLLLNAGWWLAHRFRTGDDVSQALPMITVAFRFEGELLRASSSR
jgi:hypothetical protein